jgi:hypothetical protein
MLLCFDGSHFSLPKSFSLRCAKPGGIGIVGHPLVASSAVIRFIKPRFFSLSGFTASSASKIVENNRGFLINSTFTISAMTDASGQVTGTHGLGGAPNQIFTTAFGGTFQYPQVMGITSRAVTVKLLLRAQPSHRQLLTCTFTRKCRLARSLVRN